MKKIIFDMGNTLIDFHQGIYSDDEKDQIGMLHLTHLLSKKYAKPIPAEDLNRLFLRPWLRDFYKREALIELDFQAYLEHALIQLDCDPMNLDSIECMRAYYTQYMKDAVLNHHVKEVLTQLKEKDFKIHVLSNCILSQEIYIEVFKTLEIDKYIDHYTFSYNAGVRKPTLSLFLAELEGFNAVFDDVYFVGDNLKVDILPAITVGMTGIWYNKKSIQGDIVGDFHEIRDFRELENIV